MTREERRKAIKVLSALQTLTTIDGYSEETREALDMAIEALKAEPCENCEKVREAYTNGFDYGVKDWFAAKTQPCEDCVRRVDVSNAIESVKYFQANELYRAKDITDECHKAVETLPSVTPKPKTGHWVAIDDEPHEDYECDKCGYVVSTFTANIEPHTEYKYCPNCGAKMEGESE